MTPKEKAEELVDKFIQINGNAFFAKECALIAVDEIVKAGKDVDEFCDSYWLEVKNEIIGGEQ
jgi:hypothetical protein